MSAIAPFPRPKVGEQFIERYRNITAVLVTAVPPEAEIARLRFQILGQQQVINALRAQKATR